MAMHTELWFPSVIWSSIVHVVDNIELKKWAYEKKSEDKGTVNSNYGGWQSSNVSSGECWEIDALVDHLNVEVNECARQVGLKEVELYNLWININPPGSYNHLHSHQGAIFSGVYYVDADATQGNIQFERSDNAEHYVSPNAVSKDTYFTASRTTYAAKTNALYVFPGWLKHSVQGNTSRKDRISISFNYGEKQ